MLKNEWVISFSARQRRAENKISPLVLRTYIQILSPIRASILMHYFFLFSFFLIDTVGECHYLKMFILSRVVEGLAL